MSFLSLRANVDASRWVEHTLAVERELSSVASSAAQVESEYRFFAVTGDEPTTAEIGRAHAAAEEHAGAVASLTRDNDAQQARMATLRRALDDQAAFAEDVVRARRDHGIDAARALIATGEGRRRTTSIRATIDDMQAEEGRLLVARNDRASAAATRAVLSHAALGVFVLVTMLFGYVLVRSDVLARARATDAIARSEERFRLLVDGVTDYGLYMLDPEGIVTSWNAGAERMKGYRASEIVGKSFAAFYEPADAAAGRPARELAIAAEKGRYEETAKRVRKDGSSFWANVVLTALRDDDGALRGFAKITRDVTEKRSAELALVATNASLERSNRELQEFAMIASHDLQEPLRKVQMFGDRLKEEFSEQLGERGRDYIERMQSAGARGQALIQGLLTYSRVTSKAQPFEPVDLRAVARDVVGDLEARIAERHARIEVDELPTIDADALQMRQLLQNLIGNALKFGRADEPTVVRVHASLADGELPSEGVRIEIDDNGIGFDEKYLDRIFKLFQRLHQRGAYEGAGMGLAICRKIVERHHGVITAKSTPGKGSTFLVSLPAHQPREEREGAR